MVPSYFFKKIALPNRLICNIQSENGVKNECQSLRLTGNFSNSRNILANK